MTFGLNKKGFSLIEIIVGLVIVGIMVVVLIEIYRNYYIEHQRAKINTILLEEARYAMECFRRGFYDNQLAQRAHGLKYARNVIDAPTAVGVTQKPNTRPLMFIENPPQMANGVISGPGVNSSSRNSFYFVQEDPQGGPDTLRFRSFSYSNPGDELIILPTRNDRGKYYDDVDLEVSIPSGGNTGGLTSSVKVILTITRQANDNRLPKQAIIVRLEDTFIVNQWQSQ